ncbi:MAG: hypothetical protein CL840_13320 [Crocinitomicaceae bacterium]|nr:hypothetical protein [Crocinitomicaceae bacterium]
MKRNPIDKLIDPLQLGRIPRRTNFNLKRRLKYVNLLQLIWILLIGYGCTSTQQISNSNLADLYRETEKTIKPKYQVYHLDDDLTQISFILQSTNLLYTKNSEERPFTAKVKVTYMLFESYSSNLIVDSASFVINDENNSMVRKEISGRFNMKAKYPNKYVLKMVVLDLNKGASESQFITIDKTTRNGRQNFEIKQIDEDVIEMERKFGDDKELKVFYNDPMVKKIAVKYYNRDFPLTPPPFAVYSPKRFDFTPDSMYYILLDKENSFVLPLNKKGMYHIQTDSASKEGLTLIRNEDDFPKVSNASQMVEPLRFITTNREYNAIKESEFPRDGVEEYWLTVANSPDRARELIRTFYNRVEDANQYFSTHLQGWRTDRGIIYVIFGPPDVIYKNAQGESWIYGNGKTQPSITYNFNATYNPFSTNDMRLERNPEYKTYWYKAVDTWRQGRIYKY